MAAEQGDAVIQFNLGLLYSSGKGVQQNYEEAAKWFQKSAEQGYDKALYNLGLLYSNGNGVPKDYMQAYLCFKLAAEQGIETANTYLETMAQQMTPAQIAQAQEMAKAWKQPTSSAN
jgi:TPR repeat protein